MNEIKEIILNGDKANLRRKLLSIELSIEETEKLVKLARNKGIKIIEAILINQVPSALSFYSEKEREQLIVNTISELSQDIYAAGWLHRIEYQLWEWSKQNVPEWINFRVIEDDLIDLRGMAEKLNLWAVWDEKKEEIAISLDEWKLQNK